MERSYQSCYVRVKGVVRLGWGYTGRMAKPLSRRAKPTPPEEKEGIQLVRGGGICSPGDKSAHLIRGTMQPAICRATPGLDTRARWRVAGRSNG